MTVQDLIARLSVYDPSATVRILVQSPVNEDAVIVDVFDDEDDEEQKELWLQVKLENPSWTTHEIIKAS